MHAAASSTGTTPSSARQRERTKFDELAAFGEHLGCLRRTLDEDLVGTGLTHERVVALVVSLLECTHIRVGNECYVAANGTYGLTTLRSRHVTVHGSTVRIKFAGKGGRRHDVAVTDRRIGRLVRACQDLPGQLLFQWEDGDGVLRSVTSTEVNDYLRRNTGLDVTAKTFRTWGATLLAASGFAVLPHPTTTRRRNACVKAVVEVVAEELGNTPTVARNSYIHPTVFAAYEEGALHDVWEKGPSRARGGLIAGRAPAAPPLVVEVAQDSPDARVRGTTHATRMATSSRTWSGATRCTVSSISCAVASASTTLRRFRTSMPRWRSENERLASRCSITPSV